MKRITYWALSTISALVLLFGYHTSTSGPTSTRSPASVEAPITGSVSGSAASGSTGSGSTDSGSGSTSGTNPPASSGGSKSSSSTVAGDVAQTRWGPVQVQLTVANGKLTDVSVLQYPNGNGRDVEINNQALPILIQETLDAQSANIDMVSGATVTSDGYLQSLQSALDQANL